MKGPLELTVLGDTVKYRREHEKIGVREAGKLCGVSPATLSRVENGEDPDIKTFSRICRWLSLSPTMFLDENGLK